MEVTKKQLESLIESQVKRALGADMTPEKVAKLFSDLEELRLKQDQQVLDNVQALTIERDGADHPYWKAAKHIRDEDRNFVQRGRKVDRKGLGLIATRALRAQFAAMLLRKRGESISAQDFAYKKWGEKWLADIIDEGQSPENQKNLSGGLTPAASGGGALVPVEHMRELIELLRSANVVRSSGARVIPLPSANLTMPRQTASATATYGAEATATNASNQSLDQISLAAKKLTCIVAVSNDLLVSSDPAVDAMVRDDLVMTVANREDLAFIREPAGANNPTGIRGIAGVQTQAQSGATVTAIASDYSTLIELVEGSNAPMNRPVFWMTSRTKNQLIGKVTTDEQFAFRDELSSGMFMGWPFAVSNQIPNNLGAGTNESEVYFGDASEILIGDTRMLELTIHPDSAYVDSGGTIRSGVSLDMTAFRIVSSHDIDLRHGASFAYQSAVNL